MKRYRQMCQLLATADAHANYHERPHWTFEMWQLKSIFQCSDSTARRIARAFEDAELGEYAYSNVIGAKILRVTLPPVDYRVIAHEYLSLYTEHFQGVLRRKGRTPQYLERVQLAENFLQETLKRSERKARGQTTVDLRR